MVTLRLQSDLRVTKCRAHLVPVIGQREWWPASVAAVRGAPACLASNTGSPATANESAAHRAGSGRPVQAFGEQSGRLLLPFFLPSLRGVGRFGT
jgi:hypothetical protein